MALVALLSNPNSTGNRALLPEIRSYCASQPDIFHYEAEGTDQIGVALAAIARVKPDVLVVNGGDGTVQAALTELYHGCHFGPNPPPVAVLPNGKTNLIALDLGATGNPLASLRRIVEIANGDLAGHVVDRELIALSEGELCNRPVLGMFLGGAGLADTILYCRNRIYPIGLPNGISHLVAGIAVLFSLVFNVRGKYLPPAPNAVRVSLIREGEEPRRFSFIIITTLEKMLLSSKLDHKEHMGMKLLAVEQSARALVRALWASVRGKLGSTAVLGVHIANGDLIRIESDQTSVILDGETFNAVTDRPIVLRSTPPQPFLRLAI
jgi:Diacylglycerol kinase catalytic domain